MVGFVLAAKRVSRPLNLRAAPIAFGDHRADAVACKRRDAREQRVGIDPAFVRIAQRLPPRLAPVQRGGRRFVLGDANLSVCLEPAIVVDQFSDPVPEFERREKSEGHQRETGTARSDAAPARTPRYEEIFRQLASDIRDGRYPVGGKLPPELELCATFAASRHTVREAVRRLTEQGLIARRAGAGTLVLRRTKNGSASGSPRSSRNSRRSRCAARKPARWVSPTAMPASSSPAGTCQPAERSCWSLRPCSRTTGCATR